MGLNIDIAHPMMCEFLAQQTERRQQRARLIAERLDKAHIPGAWEGALRLADGGAVTRGHFARFWWNVAKPQPWRMSLKISCPWENRLRSATVVYNRTSY